MPRPRRSLALGGKGVGAAVGWQKDASTESLDSFPPGTKARIAPGRKASSNQAIVMAKNSSVIAGPKNDISTFGQPASAFILDISKKKNVRLPLSTPIVME